MKQILLESYKAMMLVIFLAIDLMALVNWIT